MKKIINIIVITIISLMLCMCNVNAANDTLTAVVTADKTQVKQGDTVTVTFSLKDFVTGETGISAIVAKLNYDTTIFEKVTMADISGQNSWVMGAYNENEGSFTATNSMFPNTEHALLTVKLKAKENAKLGSTTVSFTEINPANTDIDFTAADKSISLTITEKSVEPTPTPTPTPTATSTPTPTPTATPTVTSKTLPTTGVETFIIPAIAIIAILGTVAYIRYNKIEK